MAISFEFGNSDIETAIRQSMANQKSQADLVRLSNIAQKLSEGKVPVSDTCEFLKDKINDKQRNTIITSAILGMSVWKGKKIINTVTPFVKKAGKYAMSFLPEKTQASLTPKIVNFLRKDLKDVKFVKNFSSTLAKVNVHNVGNALKWVVAAGSVLALNKIGHKLGDIADDKIDLSKMSKEDTSKEA